MAFLGTAGNTSEGNEDEMNKTRGGRLLEAGWYRAALVEDEVKEYDWGTGLNLQLQILTGLYENQRIFDFLCIQHTKSEQAQHIAKVRLRELGVAAGHKTPDNIEDTQPMYNTPIMVEVYRAKDDTKYAEEDGRKARVGQYMTVKQWKTEKANQHMPGVSKTVPNNSPPQSDPVRDEAPPMDDSDIPF